MKFSGKVLALILCSCILLTAAVFPASAKSFVISEKAVTEEIAMTDGNIVSLDLENNRITVSDRNTKDNIVLIIGSNTAVADNESGLIYELADLKPGDRILAYHSPALSKSLPPQADCAAIIANIKEEQTQAVYMTAGKTEEISGGIKVLSADGGYVITITDETPIRLYSNGAAAETAGIEPGTRFFAWFDVMLMSYPSQAGADEISIISFPASDGANLTVFDKIDIKGEIIGLDGKNIFEQDGLYMIPLRTVAEVLGFKVIWNADERTVSLDDGTAKTVIKIGTDSYYKASSKAIGLTQAKPLGAAPVLKDNKTYVPADLFVLLYSDPGAVYIEDNKLCINKKD